jgi:hypothetical protein
VPHLLQRHTSSLQPALFVIGTTNQPLERISLHRIAILRSRARLPVSPSQVTILHTKQHPPTVHQRCAKCISLCCSRRGIDCLLSSRLHAYRRRTAARYTSASPSHLSTGRATSKSRRRSSGCISARCTSAGILRGPGRSPLTCCESDRVGERGLRPCSDASRSNPIQRGSTPKLACSSVFVYLEYW